MESKQQVKPYSKAAIESYVREKTRGRAISGFDHFRRVYETAKKLARTYDEEVLHAACFLHDIEEDGEHHVRSAEHARAVLKDTLPEHKLCQVQHAILHHVLDGDPKSMEAILLHDADLLDYLGMIGLLRLTITAREWHNKSEAEEILNVIKNFRRLIANKLLLKQSKSKAADKLIIMDLAIHQLESEIK